MERTHIKDTINMIGQSVKLQGFVENQREMGKITFVDLRDTTGKIQCVGYQMLKDVTVESVIEIIGEVKARPEKMINPELETGTIEIYVKEYKILGKAEGLPFIVNEKANNDAEVDVRMDFRWIDLRKPEKLLTFKVWTELERAMREYWTQNSYVEIHSPKLLGAPSESGAEVFEVKYFDRKAYLAQSPQFYKQMAMAAGFERVFEVGPVFRAENSNTNRHTTEFTGYDIEVSYIESHQDIIKEEEKLLTYAIKSVKEKYGEEIKKVYGIEIEIPTIPFPQITMSEAKKVLGELGIKSEKDGDLSSEEERELGKYIKEKHNHEFVFVTDYPSDVRAFYHMRTEEGSNISRGADLLYKGLEITTLAQREHRYEVLKKQAEERGMSISLIQFYLDFFKFGCPPHGGFGMGPSRLLMKLLNLESLREAMFLFRNPRRITP